MKKRSKRRRVSSKAPELQGLEKRQLLSVSLAEVNSFTGYVFGAGDFNNDGKTDLVAGISGTGDVILLSNGNGTFAQGASFALNSGGVATGDFNNDGKLDLLINTDGQVVEYLGKGNGNMRPGRTIISTGAAAIAVGDFNGDGKEDLAIGYNGYSGGNGSVAILLGNGNGTFQAPASFSVSATYVDLMAADFNGDGKDDVAVSSSAAIQLFFGNGNGQFQAQPTLASGAGAGDLVVADFNSDGKPDLAIANAYVVDVLLNNGNGTFQAPEAVPDDGDPRGMIVGDFNGDGKPDLLVRDQNDYRYGYFQGQQLDALVSNGNGTFQADQTISNSAKYLIGSTVGDFQGDGKDGLALSYSGFTVTTHIFVPAFAVYSYGKVTITGTSGDDSILVTESSAQFTVTMNGVAEGPFPNVQAVSCTGGAGDDTISIASMPFAATIGGAGGNDSIIGGAGNDSLRGGAGNDTIGGAGGDDTIVGGGDEDSLKGGAGDDFIAGGPGNDTLHGGVGNDSLLGGTGDDVVNGNAGDDTIIAGSGSSQLFAAAGNDSIVGSTTSGYLADSIYCGGSTDTIVAGTDDSIFDSVQGDSITGGHIVS